MGTLTESINAIFGWSEWNTKIWYIVGALLGGYPLAQGTIYLLMKKRFANISAALCSTIIVVAAVCVVVLSDCIPEGFDQRLTGRVFAWQWVGAFLPSSTSTPSFFFLAARSTRPFKYFGNEKGRTPFPRQHPHCHWCAAARHWRNLYPFRPRGGLVHHGVHRTHVHLLRLRHDAEGSLRIRACKSADLGRVAFQLIRVLTASTSAG